MKTHFPGYFPPSEEEKESLWDTALFTFDANILLGLYRYSDDTKDRFLELLERIKDRCWIPHQVAKEFLRNRLDVIKEQADAYEKTSSELDTVAAKFAGEHRHPFIPEKTFKQLSESIDAVKSDLANSKERHLLRLEQDDIFSKLEKVFEGRVGAPLTNEETNRLQKEGEERYQRKIPPGYKDASKNDPSDPTRKFGDLLVWKQLMTQAKLNKSGIIFICDDRKEDWWSEFNGKTLGPRPELIKEFSDECKTSILLYRPHRFLEFAANHFQTEVPTEAVSELKEAIISPSTTDSSICSAPLQTQKRLEVLAARRSKLISNLVELRAKQSSFSEKDDFEAYIKWEMDNRMKTIWRLIGEIDTETSVLANSLWNEDKSDNQVQ